MATRRLGDEDDDGRELPRWGTGRVEAFSDGVFAIAITLLVLDLGVPPGSGEHLLESILHQWPSLLAYVTSFLTIGVIWLQHSAITGALRAVSDCEWACRTATGRRRRSWPA